MIYASILTGVNGLLIIVFLLAGTLAVSPAEPLPKAEPVWGYGFVNAFSKLSFSEPVVVVAPPGETNRLFVVERAGDIYVIDDVAAQHARLFLSLQDTWSRGVESGLLGLAFHPNFAQNGRLFTYRTVVRGGLRCELAEFQVSEENPNLADPNSEKIIISQRDGIDTHNAGDLKFGPDGYLYLSLGNEGPVLNDAHEEPQAIDKGLFAGIIRIDVDYREASLAPNQHPSVGEYRIPEDNPFIGRTDFNGKAIDPASVRTEFYAVGLRNPWRFTFDPLTRELICADVGAGAFEEINIIEKGGNYGWPFVEGNFVHDSSMTNGFTPPLYTYEHGNGNFEGRVVIGGVIVEDPALGELAGKYIFGDFESGTIWAFNTRERDTNATWLTARRGIASFSVDPRDGGVLAPNLVSGRIEKLMYRPPEELEIPTRLSELGIFDDLASLTPNSAVLPYEIINPLWSDGAVKKRWVSLHQAEGKIGFSATTPWQFPAGAFWVKHFELELTNGIPESRRRLETRVLVKSEDGVYGLSYRWGESTNDATLLPPYPTNEVFLVHDGGTVRTQVWTYPGWEQCRTCHTKAGGSALSFNTYQLNRSIGTATGRTNQLTWLAARKFFTNPGAIKPESLPNLVSMDDPVAPAQHKVRSYLFSNCSHCHQPGNPLNGPQWDGRISTRLSEAKIINENSFFYPEPVKLIAPHSEGNSFILTRVSNRSPNSQMPPMATSEVDHQFLAALRDWIGRFPDETWKYVDIGTARAEGAAEQIRGEIRLNSAAAGIESSSIYFAHREVEESSALISRVSNLRASVPGAEAGLMFRSGLDPESAYTAVFVKDGAIRFQSGEADGDLNGDAQVPSLAEANWLKLARTADEVSAWSSIDGTNWQLVGTAPFDAVPNEKYLAGLFAASAAPGVQFASAEFESTSVESLRLEVPVASPVLLPQPIAMEAFASSLEAGNPVVSFYANDELLGIATNAPYKFTWATPREGQATIQAVLTSTHGSLTSNPVAVEIEAPDSDVWPITLDTETKGRFAGRYGQAALLIPGVATNASSNVEIRVMQAQNPIRQPSDDPSALEVNGEAFDTLLPGRNVIEILFRAPDFTPRRAIIYFHNWLQLGAEQFVSFSKDGIAVSEVETVRSETGVYASFVFRGEILARIENPRGTAHLAGAFMDPVEQILVGFISPEEDVDLQQPANLALEIGAAAPGREITRVALHEGSKRLASFDSPPYRIMLSNIFSGDHLFTAIAHDSFGLSTVSAPRRVIVRAPAAEAEFLGADTRTQGNWKGRYGTAGYWIITDAFALPESVLTESTDAIPFVFTGETEDIRALESPFDGPRVAACVYNNAEFTFDVDVRDGNSTVLGLYCLDWNDAGRIMEITVLDPSGNVLDRRELDEFDGGKYLFWRISGQVRFHFSAPVVNPVVSGFFVDSHLSTYDLWRNNAFTRDEIEEMRPSFDERDYDNDGVANALEHALGFDPRDGSDAPEFQYTSTIDRLVVRISRRAVQPDWEIILETSSNFTDWIRLPIGDGGGETGEVVLELPFSEARQFFRIGAAKVN